MLKTISLLGGSGGGGASGNLTISNNSTTINNVTNITFNGGRVHGSSANVIVDSSGALLNIQQFTSGTSTYNPTPGTNNIQVTLIGGGGGGAGINASPGSAVLIGRGGTGGGRFILSFVNVANFSGATVVVGAGGLGGIGGNLGHAGTNSTITLSNSTVYAAVAGNGGSGQDGPTTNFTGDITLPTSQPGGDTGGASAHGVGFVNFGFGGDGGSSGEGRPAGRGGRAAGTNTGQNGFDSVNVGGGGGGAASSGASIAAQNGGNGAAGQVTIYEYS